MKRAVVYARVSTERQAEEGLSIDSQIAACRRKAEELGAAVVAVYRDDGLSGTTDARPGFRRAIGHCSAGGVDFLVCWSSSRFARDQHDAIAYKRELADYGTRVSYASQQLDLATHEGWLLDSFQQIFDENVSRTVSADTRRSMLSAAREGFFMGGRVPFGYEAVAVAGGKRRKLQPKEEEARLVRWAFEQAAAGLGAVSIARALNGQGLTFRGRKWAKTTVLNLLRSEVYMGEVIYNRFERKTRKPRPQAQWVRVKAHAPLVSGDAFEAAQAAIADRAPELGHAPANTVHLFAGLVQCEHCGSGMKMSTGTGRGRRIYHYYRCNSDAAGKGCQFKPMRADAFDSWMLKELVERVITIENVEAVIQQLDSAAARWVKDRASRRSALVIELRTTEGRRRNLFDVLEVQGKNALGMGDIGPRLRELNAQVQRLEAALVAIEDEQEPNIPLAGVSAEEATAVMRRLVAECESPATLRGFVASIVERVVVGSEHVRVEYHPECLLRDSAMVHSGKDWLPVRALLRTVVLEIQRVPLAA